MPDFTSPLPSLATPDGTLRLTDDSHAPKWRVFDGPHHVRPGASASSPAGLVWSVSPGEWTVLGQPPPTRPLVDLTHVRALFRLTGTHATRLMEKLCPLDLGDHMFGDGAAARTLFAAVATEIVRHDLNGAPSYLLAPSRSFALYVHRVIADAGAEFGLAQTP